jgi:hypothetical protein
MRDISAHASFQISDSGLHMHACLERMQKGLCIQHIYPIPLPTRVWTVMLLENKAKGAPQS